MIEITPSQHMAIEAHEGDVHAFDPSSQTEYVLVPTSELARMRKMIEKAADLLEQEGWADAVEEARFEMTQE